MKILGGSLRNIVISLGRRVSLRRTLLARKEGFILIMVLFFAAMILPLVTLIISIISSETKMTTAEINAQMTRASAEKSIQDAISLLLKQKNAPDFLTSVTQPSSALDYLNALGIPRWALANSGSGDDGVYGTQDDYWVGPRGDRSFQLADDYNDINNYALKFRFNSVDKPVYLAESPLRNSNQNPFQSYKINSGRIPLLNQFGIRDVDPYNGDLVAENILLPGYYPDAPTPWTTDIAQLISDPPRMMDAAVNPNDPVRTDYREGPLPQLGFDSYGNVTDEAGRLNLNIFVKKIPYWLPESANYDYDLDYQTLDDDFNKNTVDGEYIWHWADNPLFPDLYTPVPGFYTTSGPDVIDDNLITNGETTVHYYEDDWTIYAVNSRRMLSALPGIDRTLAVNILEYLNPNPEISNPPSVNPLTNPRQDVPNLSPPLFAVNINPNTGKVTGYNPSATNRRFDLPLPKPRWLTDINELLNVPGMTRTKLNRLKEYVTVFSYDTNYLSSNVMDVSTTVDPINPSNLPPGVRRARIPDYLIDRDDLPDVRYNLNQEVFPKTFSNYVRQANVLYNYVENHLSWLPNPTNPSASDKIKFKKISLPVIDRLGRGPGEPGYNQAPDQPYPLNPQWNRDAAMSLILYGQGLPSQDDYSADPTGNTPILNPGIPLPFPGSKSFIPFPGFVPEYLPDPNSGLNIDAVIQPHKFTSVADLLEVPLYKFDRLSVTAAANPPSGLVCPTQPGYEQQDVIYRTAFSDVEYNPAAFSYTMYFDWNNDGTADDQIPNPTPNRIIEFRHTFVPADVVDFVRDSYQFQFITSRVYVIRRNIQTGEETRADEAIKVYVQFNCDAVLPLRTNILVIKEAGNNYLAVAYTSGGRITNQNIDFYNWTFDNRSIAGAFPVPPGQQDPRAVNISLDSDGAGQITLTVTNAVGETAQDTYTVDLAQNILNQLLVEASLDPPSTVENGLIRMHITVVGGTPPYDIRVTFGGITNEFGPVEQFTSDTGDRTIVFSYPNQGNHNINIRAQGSGIPPRNGNFNTTAIVETGTPGGGTQTQNPPTMTASIELVPEGGRVLAYDARVSGGYRQQTQDPDVDSYDYQWEVRNDNGNLVFSSLQKSGTFDFSGYSDGMYYVYLRVRNRLPGTQIATDVAPIAWVGPDYTYPIANLFAGPPGNEPQTLDQSNAVLNPSPTVILTGGGNPTISPMTAAPGQVITIRGFGFSYNPADPYDPIIGQNIVSFPGGLAATPISVYEDPSPTPNDLIMRVIVPNVTTSGLLNVRVGAEVSNAVLFQSAFDVDCTLTGALNQSTTDFYLYQVDYQGDGTFDYSYDSRNLNQVSGAFVNSDINPFNPPIHDYAEDGFGNYTAILAVTDLVTGKVSDSKQVVQVKDLTPQLSNPNAEPLPSRLYVSIFPEVDSNILFPGQTVHFTSYVGGQTFGTLGYIWNLDTNSRREQIPMDPITQSPFVDIDMRADGRWVTPGTAVKYTIHTTYPFRTTTPGTYTMTWDDPGAPPTVETKQGEIVLTTDESTEEVVTFFRAFSLRPGERVGQIQGERLNALTFSHPQVPILGNFQAPSVWIDPDLTTRDITISSAGNHLVSLTVVNDSQTTIDDPFSKREKATDVALLAIPTNYSAFNLTFGAIDRPFWQSSASFISNFFGAGLFGALPHFYSGDINGDGLLDYIDRPSSNGLRYVEGSPGGFLQRGSHTGFNWSIDGALNPLPTPDFNFSFDQQSILVSGTLTGGPPPTTVSLATSIYIDPLAGSSTNNFQFTSYTSGGTGNYNYAWEIEQADPPQSNNFNPVPLNPSFQGGTANPTFNPARDLQNPPFDGHFRTRLTVNDGVSVATSEWVEFLVEIVPLTAQVFAVPPAAYLNDQVVFIIYAEGGEPDYDYSMDFGDGDTGSPVTQEADFVVFVHRYRQRGSFTAAVTVTDQRGQVANASETVDVADSIPLNGSIMATPSSGVGSFLTRVYTYASGGNRGAFSEYLGIIQLLDTAGVPVVTQVATALNRYDSFAEPKFDTIRIPGPGNYILRLTVIDGNIDISVAETRIFSMGYVSPVQYGRFFPRLRLDDSGRPMHAVRVWVDPLYDHSSEGNRIRLAEADIQLLGDLFAVDPNPNFLVSPSINTPQVRSTTGRQETNLLQFRSARDPYDVRPFDNRYLRNLNNSDPTVERTDFYDTFTPGRININTASETVLTALFMKIVKQREYKTVQITNGNQTFDYSVRDYSRDRTDESNSYILLGEAQELARAVVRYRNLFYASDKSGGVNSSNFTHNPAAVDHLPVIGPFEGKNPPDIPTDFGDSSAQNAYNRFNLNYYDTLTENSFYAPSDVAFVRRQVFGESDIDYAKYLNFTLPNYDYALPGAVAHDLFYPNANEFSFDARNYFAYTYNPGSTSDIDEAYRKVAQFTAGPTNRTFNYYSWILNPPFESPTDLFKVIGNETLLQRVGGDAVVENLDPADPAAERDFSGLSLFRYTERWNSDQGEYEVQANYLDDILPYIATRSYVFRVEALGTLPSTEVAGTSLVTAGRTTRDRRAVAIVDVGKFNTRELSPSTGILKRLDYKIIYYQSETSEESSL